MAVVLIHEQESPNPVLEKVMRDASKGDGGERDLGEEDAELELLHFVLLADGGRALGEEYCGRGDGNSEEEEGGPGCGDAGLRGGGVRETEQTEEALEAVEHDVKVVLPSPIRRRHQRSVFCAGVHGRPGFAQEREWTHAGRVRAGAVLKV